MFGSTGREATGEVSTFDTTVTRDLKLSSWLARAAVWMPEKPSLPLVLRPTPVVEGFGVLDGRDG